jgi:hypothetical protein
VRSSGAASISIDALHIEVPGTSRTMGDRIGALLPERLAGRLPAGAAGRLGRLDLRVVVPPGASASALSDAITESIISALGRSTKENG